MIATRPLLDSLPAWALVLIVIVVMLACAELGRVLGAGGRRRGVRGEGKQLDTIVAAALGLLAFLLAFTFGAAAARFDERRALVIKDANAIETTYLRAAMLPAPYAERSRALLRDYIRLRVEHQESRATLEETVAKSEAIQEQLWAEASKAAAAAPTPITAVYVQTLNDLIDVNRERVTFALEYRVPRAIWAGLSLVTIFSMVLVGSQMGLAGYVARAGVVLLAICFALVIVLIVALDRPSRGLAVNQSAMVGAEQSMTR